MTRRTEEGIGRGARLVGTVTVGACGATVKIKCLEPVAAAEGVDVLGVLDRHAREIMTELGTGQREGGAE